eukprot:gnl/TRDRNA2_/TRDRNA2_75270_c0_seq1.p1 gnl/TRDRNA2_/TRDRNA2_75270_c0~~gnl/TRDRNA2_/TRDRNA2_75270_c0_seq1.p1  ORF type:complete len:294 (+),score=32.76 gnl/TRDRNA2_/TRDRNA2_75270_c0_seq1:576-1457(+)
MVKERRMEAEHMLVTPECDAAHGYGRDCVSGSRLSGWARFYGLDCFPSHSEAAAEEGQGRYHRIQSQCRCCWELSDAVWTDAGHKYCESCMTWWYDGSAPAWEPDTASYLDGLVYKRRVRATVEPFLVYASQLGEKHRVSACHGAHVRVTGLGLGCWWVTPLQEVLIKEVYSEVIQIRTLPGIDILEFANFPSGDVPTQSEHIEVRASKCGFAEPVGERLLVAMYAWDGNSHPGNEWWGEDSSGWNLCMSDDSTAASCSLIASLQHPAVNVERLSAASAQMLTMEGTFVGFLG